MSEKKKIELSDEEWRSRLSEEQFQVLRKKGTERPFAGKLYHTEDEGVYLCAGCGQELFSSQAKYDSGSGWPSFYDTIDPAAVEQEEDRSHNMRRTEIVCSRCGGHLGHIFNDGPEPTGLRFCTNSASLSFRKKGQP